MYVDFIERHILRHAACIRAIEKTQTNLDANICELVPATCHSCQVKGLEDASSQRTLFDHEPQRDLSHKSPQQPPQQSHFMINVKRPLVSTCLKICFHHMLQNKLGISTSTEPNHVPAARWWPHWLRASSSATAACHGKMTTIWVSGFIQFGFRSTSWK